ncbi:hypothetical protein HPO96_36530 [Kribbella sandramycini]|uniref:Kelch motif protein n=1 Tax=Kribbella sandramycini TaxID=60450 RepID=A0A7Y4L9M8_9ACTN|nr:hypothetical protein [Kribbella sandramycini]
MVALGGKIYVLGGLVSSRTTSRTTLEPAPGSGTPTCLPRGTAWPRPPSATRSTCLAADRSPG